MKRPHEFRSEDLPPARVFTDAPLEHMWARFGLAATGKGALKLIGRLAEECGCESPGESLGEKAMGVAFAVRTAREYFRPRAADNPTLSALSYYYGTVWLLAALMMADPTTDTGLAKVESYMDDGGHGLGNVDDPSPSVSFPDDMFVHLNPNGLFSAYLKSCGTAAQPLLPNRRINAVEDLENQPHWSLTELLARVPELLETWDEVMARPPAYVAVGTNSRPHGPGKLWWVYPQVDYLSRYLASSDDGLAMTGLERTRDEEILQITRGHPWVHVSEDPEAPFPSPLYTSAWAPTSYIKPIADGIDTPIHYHFCALYCLSILVRYQPHRWREIREGGKEFRLPLVTDYLAVAERIVPNLFLDRLFLRRHILAGHSYLG